MDCIVATRLEAINGSTLKYHNTETKDKRSVLRWSCLRGLYSCICFDIGEC